MLDALQTVYRCPVQTNLRLQCPSGSANEYFSAIRAINRLCANKLVTSQQAAACVQGLTRCLQMTSIATGVCIAIKLQSMQFCGKHLKMTILIVGECTWVAIAFRLEARCDAQE